MTWKGTLLTVAGFDVLFAGYEVSSPAKSELGVYQCMVRETLVMGKTLTDLAREVLKQLGVE